MKEQETAVWEQTMAQLGEGQGAGVTVLDSFDPNLGRPSGGGKPKPADLIGVALLVKVVKVHSEINTSYGTKDAVDVDIFSIGNKNTARDCRWFNPAVVDALSPYEGKVVPLKLSWQTGASGRAYIAAESLSEIEEAAAKAVVKESDPFAPEEAAAQTDDEPEEQPRW